MIHLALLTNRTPILFPFPPSLHLRYINDADHIPPSLPFDTVFDLPRLSYSIGIPLVRISELKTRVETKPLLGDQPDEVHPVEEEIGGWSIWMVTNPEWHKQKTQEQLDAEKEEGVVKEVEDGRRCYQLDTYRISLFLPVFCFLFFPFFVQFVELEFLFAFSLEPYFSPVPETFRPVIDWTSVHFGALASLWKPQPNAFVDYYLTKVPEYFTARHRDPPKLAPDDHVVYIDFLYNLGEANGDSRYDWTGRGVLGKVGAWESVGKYMRWEPELEELTRGYIRRALGVKDKTGAKVPPVSGHPADWIDICRGSGLSVRIDFFGFSYEVYRGSHSTK